MALGLLELLTPRDLHFRLYSLDHVTFLVIVQVPQRVTTGLSNTIA
jgi:hypothetical protein